MKTEPLTNDCTVGGSSPFCEKGSYMKQQYDAIYVRQSVDRIDSISVESQAEFCKRETDGQVVYSATLITAEEFSSSELNDIMQSNEFICSIERCDNN